jgi:hypothetical protein
VPEITPISARDFFNAGTSKLHEGRLRDAETLLQAAVASQIERWQPVALYNLAHVRFAQGMEELKQAPDGRPTASRARTATQGADAAIRLADAALSGNDVQKLVAAYQHGRGVRKELRAATAAVRRAMETHGSVLSKWQRASGDFKSAVELRSNDADARHNAEVVDRHIAKLVDSLTDMQQACSQPGNQGQELAQKLNELRGRIPASLVPPGAAGDEEDESDYPQGPEPGQQEAPPRSGKEMSMSREEVSRILDGYKLGGNNRLPLGPSDAARPKDPSRPTW